MLDNRVILRYNEITVKLQDIRCEKETDKRFSVSGSNFVRMTEKMQAIAVQSPKDGLCAVLP